MTARKHGWQSPEAMVKRLNRTKVRGAQYFSLGNISPAYAAVKWIGRKYGTKSENYVRIPVQRLGSDYGLFHLARQALH